MQIKNFQTMDNLIVETRFNPSYGEFRVLTLDGKVVLFHANDIARCLNYKDPKNVVYRYVSNDRKVLLKPKNIKAYKDALHLAYQGSVFINESGFYELIVHSQLPSARAFQDWVYDVVLPHAMKHTKDSRAIEIYDFMHTKQNPTFKKDMKKGIRENSIAHKKLKGYVWRDFIRIFYDQFGEDIPKRINHLVKKYDIKRPTIREFLDAMDQCKEALIVLEYMKLAEYESLTKNEVLHELVKMVENAHSKKDVDKAIKKAEKRYVKERKQQSDILDEDGYISVDTF